VRKVDIWVVLLVVAGGAGSASGQGDAGQSAGEPKSAVKGAEAPEATGASNPKNADWRSLIPKSGLTGWEITDFGSQGEVNRDGETLILEMGDPLTGINYTGKNFPKNNFEIELEAQRVEGNDFMCGLTFPVGSEFCSFIAGGWGGGVVGLSSIDGYDASENSTSSYHSFDNGKWYRFRVAVDDQAVRAWINDELFCEQERAGHEFTTRIEVYVSQPLGLCAFQSKVAVKNFRWRKIGDSQEEKKDEQDSSASEQKAGQDAPEK
jgi:hypothetical protein